MNWVLRASACAPHRAHVHGRRSPAGRSQDDPWPRTARRAAALEEILPMQRADFEELTAMKGLPSPCVCSTRRCTSSCRTTPTRGAEEFRPRSSPVARRTSWSASAPPSPGEEAARAQPDARHPRLPAGHAVPGDPDMQARAIIRATRPCWARSETVGVEIMIRWSASSPRSRSSARSWLLRWTTSWPRPARRSLHRGHHDRVATCGHGRRPDQLRADFFDFGTNDLTQAGLGISRDDAENASSPTTWSTVCWRRTRSSRSMSMASVRWSRSASRRS